MAVTECDLAIVGAGPAGSAAALAALRARPGLSVLLLDRADFPRDKPCGDGIAPHVIDVLQRLGMTDVLDDRVPIDRLRLERDGVTVARTMRRPGWVVPRSVFDQRLVETAVAAGARLLRHRVRDLHVSPGWVVVDGRVRARFVVGADGASSVVRRTLRLSPQRRAVALRGYAPTGETRSGEQVIVFGTSRQPSYAWSFDRGDGLANVGYGEVLHDRHPGPSRQLMLDRLETLMPGSTAHGTDWRGHHLPLASLSWSHPTGRVLLAGDAAGLVNPMTGEGIYQAVVTGALAGETVAHVLTHDRDAGSCYRTAVRAALGRHRRHTSVAARLSASGPVLDAVLRAAAARQDVFDDLVEVGLGQGLTTRRLLGQILRSAVTRGPHVSATLG